MTCCLTNLTVYDWITERVANAEHGLSLQIVQMCVLRTT